MLLEDCESSRQFWTCSKQTWRSRILVIDVLLSCKELYTRVGDVRPVVHTWKALTGHGKVLSSTPEVLTFKFCGATKFWSLLTLCHDRDKVLMVKHGGNYIENTEICLETCKRRGRLAGVMIDLLKTSQCLVHVAFNSQDQEKMTTSLEIFKKNLDLVWSWGELFSGVRAV